MGLAYRTKFVCSTSHTRSGASLVRTGLTVLRDGLLVAGTATVFAGTAIVRYGWDALTDSAQTYRMLLEFTGIYLCLALVLATAWMVVKRIVDGEAGFERSWLQGYPIAVTLLIAVIAFVPPIWD